MSAARTAPPSIGSTRPRSPRQGCEPDATCAAQSLRYAGRESRDERLRRHWRRHQRQCPKPAAPRSRKRHRRLNRQRVPSRPRPRDLAPQFRPHPRRARRRHSVPPLPLLARLSLGSVLQLHPREEPRLHPLFRLARPHQELRLRPHGLPRRPALLRWPCPRLRRSRRHQ
jgi:hypothetical protein